MSGSLAKTCKFLFSLKGLSEMIYRHIKIWNFLYGFIECGAYVEGILVLQ